MKETTSQSLFRQPGQEFTVHHVASKSPYYRYSGLVLMVRMAQLCHIIQKFLLRSRDAAVHLRFRVFEAAHCSTRLRFHWVGHKNDLLAHIFEIERDEKYLVGILRPPAPISVHPFETVLQTQRAKQCTGLSVSYQFSSKETEYFPHFGLDSDGWYTPAPLHRVHG